MRPETSEAQPLAASSLAISVARSYRAFATWFLKAPSKASRPATDVGSAPSVTAISPFMFVPGRKSSAARGADVPR